MRTIDINTKTVKIQQVFKALEVAIQAYIKTKDDEMGKLAIKTAKDLIKDIEDDYQNTVYISNIERR